MKPIVGPGCSTCCSVLSAIGIIFLIIVGAMFGNRAPQFAEAYDYPDNYDAIASSCYAAAGIYAGFLAFCCCQVGTSIGV
ncbi:hypothetical protein IWQ60_004646 [Tieghemiomyces parasiticus]|uniref:Uncharacterized protein n=1 Tax=Tieghemiomyces parasiticus TaxID=78921 RepID=A0A9W8A7U5_9FUNG|nr:hypothetical protein IWQ60_004646 [Tieghemiomyces parasiticus]